MRSSRRGQCGEYPARARSTIVFAGYQRVMAKNHGASVKDDKTYEALRDKGASKEKAARIANAKAGGGDPSRKGGKASSYEDQTKDQLMRKARQVGIDGRSKMSKPDLVDALRNH